MNIIRKHKEADFSIVFRHWIKANPRLSATFEMKDTRGKNRLLFSEVKQVQIDWGLAINSEKGVLMRMQAVAEGMPDYAYYRNAPAYVVIKYPRFFCLIDIGTFDHERSKSKDKSLSSSRAKEIASTVVELSTPCL